jgi:hypothetical protein
MHAYAAYFVKCIGLVIRNKVQLYMYIHVPVLIILSSHFLSTSHLSTMFSSDYTSRLPTSTWYLATTHFPFLYTSHFSDLPRSSHFSILLTTHHPHFPFYFTIHTSQLPLGYFVPIPEQWKNASSPNSHSVLLLLIFVTSYVTDVPSDFPSF